MSQITCLGYACGIAAADPGCGDGPLILQQSDLIKSLQREGLDVGWGNMLMPTPVLQNNKLLAVAELCTQLADHTCQLVQQNKFFVVLGGDHSSAIGTWSGVFAAQHAQGSMGLIWVDAHLDSHTHETSVSGNIHGMPLASLLGYGAKELSTIMTLQPKVKPEHLSLIGVRSFERGEAELVQRLGVRVYYMDEIRQRGLEEIMQEARARACSGTIGYGLSIDLDAIDPIDAPGVGSPEANGIASVELCKVLRGVYADDSLLGVEIAEFNPHRDKDGRTVNLIKEILLNIFKVEDERLRVKN